jgi:hypothetical protein
MSLKAFCARPQVRNDRKLQLKAYFDAEIGGDPDPQVEISNNSRLAEAKSTVENSSMLTVVTSNALPSVLVVCNKILNFGAAQ